MQNETLMKKVLNENLIAGSNYTPRVDLAALTLVDSDPKDLFHLFRG